MGSLPEKVEESPRCPGPLCPVRCEHEGADKSWSPSPLFGLKWFTPRGVMRGLCLESSFVSGGEDALMECKRLLGCSRGNVLLQMSCNERISIAHLKGHLTCLGRLVVIYLLLTSLQIPAWQPSWAISCRDRELMTASPQGCSMWQRPWSSRAWFEPSFIMAITCWLQKGP